MVTRALTAVPSLKTVDMWGSKFTLQSMQAIVSMFQRSQSLTKVDISECSIDSDSASCLARVLHSNTALKVLYMWVNSVGERGALAMAEMLKHNTTLTVLNMRNNSVGERGALAMAEMLKHNTTLTELDMRENSVGEKGALAMAEILKHNTTLTELDMCENSMGERGALAMADDSIGVEGAKALVESLAVNHHLNRLWISKAYQKEVEALPAYHANKKRIY